MEAIAVGRFIKVSLQDQPKPAVYFEEHWSKVYTQKLISL